MSRYSSDSRVQVHPFTHRREGDEVIIVDLDRQVFVTIPAEGLDILDSLAAGKTVGETVRDFEDKHAETPDIEGFLDALSDEGIIQVGDSPVREKDPDPVPARRSWHLTWITESAARRIVSTPVVTVCCLLIGLAVVISIVDFPVVPPPEALLFPDHFAALTWATVAIASVSVVLHEVAHLVAARAVGVPARIGMGNQMYIIVALTDMSGIWMVPRRRRYVAYLAGTIVDALSGTVIIYLEFADHQGWITIPPVLLQLLRAVLFTYIFRITFQCFLFVRTDFYYVLANALNCKNLLADTQDFLRNVLNRLHLNRRGVDQSGIPAREMRIVRLYSLVWLLGRALAIAVLIFWTLPILGGYLEQVWLLVSGGHSRFGSLDFATLFVLAAVFEGGGLFMWLRGMYRDRRRSAAEPPAARQPQDLVSRNAS